ncbi:MAG: hypothetical protein RBS39_04390 [Phycisphaerales bacterium]|jgi:hypothetical protein|nr:hypothetical protein [Phycisphaerales bacterium]
MRVSMLAAVVLCAGCGLAAADVIVNDGQFADGTWMAEELPTAASGSFAQRGASGGNPGAAWSVAHFEFSPGITSSLVHRELTTSYEFGVDGGIPIALRYRVDARANGGIDPFRQELRFLVTEDGIDYVSTASVVISESTWITRNSGFLTINDFQRLDGGAGVPNFTGELRFGFVTRIAPTPESIPKLSSTGYDNFRLEVIVPGPGTLSLLAAGGLVATRRRR